MAFLRTSGIQFTLNGERWVPYGASVYGYYGSNAAYLNRISRCEDAGYNMLRYVNFLQTGVFPDLYDDSVGSEFNESIWSKLDYGLEQARLAGIKILLDLSDLQGICTARGFSFGTTEMLAMYENFAEVHGERVNTVNGRVYKDDDTIGLLSIVGEVGQIGAVGSTTNYDTYHAIGGYFKAAGWQQLIHAGGQKPEQNVDSSYGYTNYSAGDYLSSPNIDCISVHPYYTQQNMIDLHPIQMDYAIKRGKPWFIEEVGYSAGDFQKCANLKFALKNGFKNRAAGFLYWNFDDNGTDGFGFTGFGVRPARQPETYGMLKAYASIKNYSPRIPVI